jgi:hypothetical protein
MARADDLAEKLRDQAIKIVMARGAITVTSPEQHTFRDPRLRVEHWPGPPCAIDIYKIGDGERKVFGAIWNPDDHIRSRRHQSRWRDCELFVVLHFGGSWESYLGRVARGCG